MKRFFPFLFSVVFFVGCSSQKELAYFSGLTSNSSDTINKYFKSGYEARICTGDVLSITVTGLDPLAVAPFNLPLANFATPGSDQIYASPTLQTYLVDVNGSINFPVLGQIELAGLTKSEAISLINKRLEPYLQNSIVTIQFMNYSITILGEVLRPGQYRIVNERVTLLEALGLAGDMTVYGMRENVLLTREINGKLEFVRLNLNSDEIFKSPYFYLRQNDVIYVEPNRVKSIASQNISLYLSAVFTFVTTIAVIFSITK